MVAATIEKARACLTKQGLRVTGGLVLPSQGPDKPHGELVVVNGAAPVFIAYYGNSRVAQHVERQLIENAKRRGGQVVRRGAVSVVWSRPPRPQLRSSVETCAFG